MRLATHITACFFMTIVCFCTTFFFPVQSHANTQKPRIGLFIFNLNDVYINSVASNIKKYLDKNSELTIFSADSDPSLQTEQIILYLKKDVEALIINLVDVKISPHIVNLVRKKNIPLIFFNREPDLAHLKNYKNAHYIGTNASEASVIQGDIIAKLWKENPQFDRNNDGVCNFIMLQGGIDNHEALLRSRVSVQSARAHGIKMQQIGDTIICNWDAECAYNASKQLFTAHGKEIEFIISNNDDMAIGAIKTLQELGFNTKNGKAIPVVGIDAIDKAKKAITAGSMHGTVLQDAEAMAKTVATMTLNATAKKPLLENIPYSWDATGIAVRIPYKAYEE